jgi:hypothetical protein
MISVIAAVCRTPGYGAQYTCCTRNHEIEGRKIQCDKVVIGKVVWTMLKKKIDGLLTSNKLEYRVWRALVPHFMRGLACEEIPEPSSRVSDFLIDFKFEHALDDETREGEWLGSIPLRVPSTSVDFYRRPSTSIDLHRLPSTSHLS